LISAVTIPSVPIILSEFVGCFFTFTISLKNRFVKAKEIAETARKTRICPQRGTPKYAGIIEARAPIANQIVTRETVTASATPRITARISQTSGIGISNKKTASFLIFNFILSH
jgi:hypothetical protein